MSKQETKQDTGALFPSVNTRYTAAEKQALVDLYTSFTPARVQQLKVVDARIVSIGEKDVCLDLGGKSDGFLPITDFKDAENLKVGDTTGVYVEHAEDMRGRLVISRRKALHLKAWKTLEDAKAGGEVLEGLVKRPVKGGLVVDISGIEVFLPGGQVDTVRTSSDELEGYVGRIVEVLVVKTNHKKQNVVVSRRMLIEREHEKHNKAFLSSLQQGQVLVATITSIATFGLFLRIDKKIVGLLHRNDIASSKRIQNVTEVLDDKGEPVFKVGQEMEVVVKDIDLEKNHICLSTKLLSWSKLPEDVGIDSKIKGVVKEIADSFALLEVMDGVIAFLHVSEMSHGARSKKPQDFVELEQTLEVAVLDIDRAKHELQVSLKKLIANPWESGAVDQYKVNTVYPATVSNVIKHGAFLTLEGGVEGFLDQKHLSWTEKVQDVASVLKKGDVKDVMVLDIDRESYTIFLGLRETTENPWSSFREVFVPGSVHECTVLKMVNGGAIVELPQQVHNFLPSKELDSIEESKRPKEGGKLSLRVVRFIEEEQKVILSSNTDGKPSEVAKTSPPKRQYTYQESQTTLGDLEVLKQLKRELAEKDKVVKKKDKRKK